LYDYYSKAKLSLDESLSFLELETGDEEFYSVTLESAKIKGTSLGT
jgi:hypothetical protein